jgi:hypothetical protein
LKKRFDGKRPFSLGADDSVQSLVDDTRSTSYRVVGSPQRQSIEQAREARFVSITGGALAIWLDPFGMLDAKVVVNLLPKLGLSVDLVRHGNFLLGKIHGG